MRDASPVPTFLLRCVPIVCSSQISYEQTCSIEQASKFSIRLMQLSREIDTTVVSPPGQQQTKSSHIASYNPKHNSKLTSPTSCKTSIAFERLFILRA